MPKENIQRAIKRGTGESDGLVFEEVLYEGYGAGGIGHPLRSPHRQPQPHRPGNPQNLRTLPTASSAPRAASPGCSRRKGLFLAPAAKIDEEKLLEIALEAGADDVKRDGDNFAVTCDPAVYREVGKALADAGVPIESSQVARLPKNTVDLDAENARKVLKLLERLDDHDDVQSVASNFNIPDEVMAEIGEG